MTPCGLSFFLFCIHFITDNAGVPSAAAFDVIFLLLDFVNLAAENCMVPHHYFWDLVLSRLSLFLCCL